MTDMTDETKGDGMTLDDAIEALDATHPSTGSKYSDLAWSAVKRHLAAQSAMRVDELLDASEALVLALGKRGIHISFYDAKAALQAAIGGKE